MSELMLDVGQANEFKLALRREGNWTNEAVKRLCEQQGLLGQVLDILEGRAKVVPIQQAAPEPEIVIDPIVRVDRSIRPTYPGWVNLVVHPELENTGPTEFDLGKLELWLHEEQQSIGYAKGQKIHDHLRDNKMLEGCLGLRDGEEIQKKGLAAFQKYFKGKALPLWKSVVQDGGRGLGVPYLFGYGGGVIMYWGWLGGGFGINNPAVRFGK